MTDALEALPDPQSVLEDDKPQLDLDSRALQNRWVLEIERYERKAQQFEKRGKLILQRYTAEKKDEQAKTTTFNVLWSNVQTLKPALYSKDPTPEVERRFKDKDPVGLKASEVLERCCVNVLAMQNFGDCVRQAVLDRLLPGRGVMWVRYLPHFSTPGSEADGSEISGDAPEDVEEVISEEVKFDFVPWTDFGHQVARTWEECDAVWRIAYLDRQEVRRRFGAEIAAALPYDQKPDGLDKDAEGQDPLNKTKVYEIWDRRTKRVIRLHKAHPTCLEIQDDPLELDGFWPIPLPLQATTSSKSIIPTADYILWQDQAKELDRLSHRIAMLTRAVKAVGVYDSSVQALGQLLSGGSENQLVPVDSWAAFAEKGGVKGAVELLDVSSIAQILLDLYEAREKVKADIYEISGLSDLIRGASDPEETATAQQIKSNYASVRLKDMQREVQVFARNGIKIAAEIICGHFSLATIRELSGVQLLTRMEKAALQAQIHAAQQYQQAAAHIAQQSQQPGAQPLPPAMLLGPPPPPPDPKLLPMLKQPSWEDVEALLRNRPARNFRIDIETDSTIMQDERAEQEARLGFAEMVGKLLTATVESVTQVPELAPAVTETFMFVLRAFKVGRPTESAFQEAMDKLAQQAQNPQPKPSPEQIKIQGEMQLQQAKIQGDKELAQAKAQADAQLEQLRAEANERIEQAKAQAQAALSQAQLQHQAQIEQIKANHEQQLEEMRVHADMQGKGHDHAHEQQGRAHEQAVAASQQQHDAALAAVTDDFNRWKAKLDNDTKVIVAQIQAQASAQSAVVGAASKVASGGSAEDPPAPSEPVAPKGPDPSEAIAAAVAQFTTAIQGMTESLSRPRTVVRGADGKISGVH